MRFPVYFLIVIISFLFSACAPQRISLYPNEFNQNIHDATYWNALLLSPDEYPKGMVLKPSRTVPYLQTLLTKYPGFIDMQSFSSKMPQHPLASLERWYSASFYQKDRMLHYMVMEFKHNEEAMAYLSHLRSLNDNDAIKILRYKQIIITMQVHDHNNKLLSQEDAGRLYTWIENKQIKIMSEL